MSLPIVAHGDPHVAAHNDEREIINTILTGLGEISGGTEVNFADVGYDIVALLGQSKMQGDTGGAIDPAIDVTDPRVYTYNATGSTAGKIALASDPLGHLNSDNTVVGPGTSLGRWLAGCIPGNRRVLLVPCGYNATGLLTGSPRWSVVADQLYSDSVDMCLAAKAAAGANSRFLFAAWDQGETDALAGITGVDYQNALETLIVQFRDDLDSAELPFLIGSFSPEFLNNYIAPTKVAIDAAHKEVPLNIAYTYFVQGPSGLGRGDDIHYSPAGSREMGRRFVAGYAEALKNVGNATIPGPITVIGAVSGNTQLTASWTPPATHGSPITEYVVNYRVKSPQGSWVNVPRIGSAPTQVITGLTNGIEYEVRVAAINAIGTGPWSTLAVGTPIAPPIASDNFTRIDGSDMGTTETGDLDWATINGSGWGIASGKARPLVSEDNNLVAVDDDEVDGIFEAQITIRDAGTAIVWRMTDANNWYCFLVSSALTQMCKYVGGSLSVVGPATTSADGDVWRVEYEGTLHKVYRNGALVAEVTDSAHTTGQLKGFRADSNLSRFDNMKLYN